MEGKKVIVIGAGLAGLSAALYLQEKGIQVEMFERNPYIGGRTASWDADGMKVESGLHRYLGFFSELPRLLRMAGIDPNKILYWEDEIIIMLKGQKPARFGLAPLFKPLSTIAGAIGNTHFLTYSEKFRLARFFVGGVINCIRNPGKMDRFSILEYAKKKKISDNLILRIVVPFSSGLFFLPPERYSAYVFFGIFIPFLPRVHKSRVGAFEGGMTEVMANPLADKIRKQGGVIHTNQTVEELIYSDGNVSGIITSGKKSFLADHIVLAASLVPAQTIINATFASHPWFAHMLQLKFMPSVTIQIELTERITKKDRTTFAPETILAAFSEQSHSTFKHTKGRLSIILTPPERFENMPHDEILELVIKDAEQIGLNIRDKIIDYRVIIEPMEFYSLEPGAEALKPTQKTPFVGLTLAGDYTKQKYLATMEGAVYSGKLAAKNVISQFKKYRSEYSLLK